MKTTSDTAERRMARREIEPVSLKVDLVQRSRLLVAVPRTEVDPLTAEVVEQTLSAFRRGRSFQD